MRNEMAVGVTAFELDVQSAGDNCRQKGHAIKILGQVYDWCYPLLSDEDKHDLMYLAQMISIDMEIGFPPDGQTIICGHGSENQIYRDWLTMAIAAYDEYPDAYSMVAGKVFSPESAQKVDCLLNVMYVCEADDPMPVERATLIETNAFAGAKIFDRVVLFHKEKLCRKETVAFAVAGEETALKINVAGLAAGTWRIRVNGEEMDMQTATEEGGMICFTASAGTFELIHI